MSRAGWITGLLIAIAAFALVLPGIQAMRNAARQVRRDNDLKVIGLGLHNYHDTHLSLPPAYLLGPDEKPRHSWRTLLLPFVIGEPDDRGLGALYAEYDFDEPWEGPRNRRLHARIPTHYQAKLNPGKRSEVTPYQVVLGSQTMWPGQVALNFNCATDGTANTLAVMEVPYSDVVWCEPRDLRFRQAARIATGKWRTSRSHGSLGYLRFDGSIHRYDVMEERFFAAYICAQGNDVIVRPHRVKGLPPDLPADGDSVEDRHMFRKVSSVTGLDFAPVLDTEIPPAKTLVWCATMQLMWSEYRAKFPGEFAADPAFVTKLDAAQFPKTALREESYFVYADSTARDGVFRTAMQSRFPDFALDGFLTPVTSGEFRTFAYLQKSLPFVDVLEELEGPLTFGGEERSRSVRAFGMVAREDYVGESGEPTFKEQVFIRDYISDANFVLELATKAAAGDRILLAKMKRPKTMLEGWRQVSERIAKPDRHHDRPHLMEPESLAIPVLEFNHDKQFTEFGTQTSAHQLIRFRLNHQGAELISAAESLTIDASGEPVKVPRKFIFDSPFLLALIEKDASDPYFAAWIGTDDVMQSVADPPK